MFMTLIQKMIQQKNAKKVGAILKHEGKRGKGYVIRTMSHEIDDQSYRMVDGDNNYPAESARKIANIVLILASFIFKGSSFDCIDENHVLCTWFKNCVKWPQSCPFGSISLIKM